MNTARTLLLIGSIVLGGCGGGGDDGGGPPAAVDPASPNDVARAVLFKIGGTTATTSTAALPTPSSDPAAPVASTQDIAVKADTVAGSSASITLSFEVASIINTLFAKVGGSDTLFTATVPSGGKVTQQVTVTLQLESAFATGQFCIDFAGRDADGRVSNAQNVCVLIAPDDVLQGSYTFVTAGPTSFGVLTFFSDGNYVLTLREVESECENNGVGVEVATYDWNAVTGALTTNPASIDTDGECGLAGTGPESYQLTKNNDGTLTLTVDDEGVQVITLTPVASAPGTRIGSFQLGNSGTELIGPEPVIFTLLDSSHYVLSTTNTDTGGAVPGIEVGCYSVDPSTNVLTADVSPTSQTCTTATGQGPVDTNGQGGLSHGDAPTLIVVNGSTIRLTPSGEAPITLTRIPTL